MVDSLFIFSLNREKIMFQKLKENYDLYKSHYFAGNELYCPFCAKFFRMDSYSKFGGKSNFCPICASSKEERTLLLFLQSRTELLKGDLKILVISEKNEITEYFKNFPNTEVKIFDQKRDLRIRDESLKDKYPNNHFDIIICNYIFEKLVDYSTVLNEIKRVVKESGFIILQANIDESREETFETHHTFYEDRFKLYGILGNFRRFGKDYMKVLNQNGLSVLGYDFELGLDEIPDETLYNKYKIYLGHKEEAPTMENCNADVNDAIDEHFRSIHKSILKSLIYMFVFLIPETINWKLSNISDSLSENQKNKNKSSYVLYVVFMGLFLVWSSFMIMMQYHYISNIMFKSFYLLITIPPFLFFGYTGVSLHVKYVFDKGDVNRINKLLVSTVMMINIWFLLFKIFGVI